MRGRAAKADKSAEEVRDARDDLENEQTAYQNALDADDMGKGSLKEDLRRVKSAKEWINKRITSAVSTEAADLWAKALKVNHRAFLLFEAEDEKRKEPKRRPVAPEKPAVDEDAMMDRFAALLEKVL